MCCRDQAPVALQDQRNATMQCIYMPSLVPYPLVYDLNNTLQRQSPIRKTVFYVVTLPPIGVAVSGALENKHSFPDQINALEKRGCVV